VWPRRFGDVDNCRRRSRRQLQHSLARWREWRERFPETSAYGVYQYPALAPRARVLHQHVPVQAAQNTDRGRAPSVRETGEDLVSEPACQVQEGRSRRRLRCCGLLFHHIRQVSLRASQHATCCRLPVATCVHIVDTNIMDKLIWLSAMCRL